VTSRGTTDLAVFANGAIRHTAVIPIAGDQVTNDIAVSMRTPTQYAEDIKIRYACALSQLANPDESIEVPSVGDRPARRSRGKRSRRSSSRATRSCSDSSARNCVAAASKKSLRGHRPDGRQRQDGRRDRAAEEVSMCPSGWGCRNPCAACRSGAQSHFLTGVGLLLYARDNVMPHAAGALGGNAKTVLDRMRSGSRATFEADRR